MLTRTVLLMEVLNSLQPVAWSFGISGKDLHVHHNTIIAISENKVCWLTSYGSALDLDLSGRPSHTTRELLVKTETSNRST